jgi:hypothetical protein
MFCLCFKICRNGSAWRIMGAIEESSADQAGFLETGFLSRSEAGGFHQALGECLQETLDAYVLSGHRMCL